MSDSQDGVKRLDIMPRGDWFQVYQSADGTFVHYSDYLEKINKLKAEVQTQRSEKLKMESLYARRDMDARLLENTLVEQAYRLAAANSEIEELKTSVRNQMSTPHNEFPTRFPEDVDDIVTLTLELAAAKLETAEAEAQLAELRQDHDRQKFARDIADTAFMQANEELNNLKTRLEKMDEDFFLKIVRKWKHSWMDESDYFERAFNVDANMSHDLADKLSKEVNSKKETYFGLSLEKDGIEVTEIYEDDKDKT